MKRFTLLFLFCLPCLGAFAQDWKVFNDTLVYYYQASNTNEVYTLRTEWKSISQFDSSYHFINNLIPCDDCTNGPGQIHAFVNEGSIYGKVMNQKGDSIWFDQDVLFVNNVQTGNSHSFSTIDGTIINFDHSTDTSIFGFADSVRYYNIDDGSQLIQSKSFGFLKFPKQHTDSIVDYELIGVEGVAGASYNDYNSIFDFQIGDKLYYEDWYSSYDGVSVTYDTQTLHYSMTIVAIYDQNGLPYYEVHHEGMMKEYHAGSGTVTFTNISSFDFYPTLYFDWEIDFPGEPVRGDRGGNFNSPFSNLIQDNIFLGHIQDTVNGNYVHIGGITDATPSNYQTFGELVMDGWEWDYNYCYDFNGMVHFPCNFPTNPIFISYEEGFGRTHFMWDGFEHKYSSHLIGAIKDGDTLGQIAANIETQPLEAIRLYPNPAQDFLYLSQAYPHVSIYAIDGHLLRQENDVEILDVSDLSSGIYLLHLVDKLGIRYQAKFIKN